MNEWKRMDEEIPKERRNYLVYMPYMKAILIAYWDKGRFKVGGNISHWMELPEKPSDAEAIEVGLNKGYLMIAPKTDE